MIAKMDRVEIVCLREILQEVIACLQDKALMHIEEVPLAIEDAPDFLGRIALSDEQAKEAEALENLHRSLVEVVPLLSVKPTPQAVIEAATTLRALSHRDHWAFAKQWVRELRSFTRRKINAQDNLEVLKSFQRVLIQLGPVMQGKQNLVLGVNARAFVLKGDVGRVAEQLDARLKEAIGLKAEFQHQRIGRDTMAGLVSYPEAHDETITKIFREEGIAPLDAPDKSLRGLPLDQVMAKIDQSITQQQNDLAAIQGELDAFSKDVGARVAALELTIRDETAKYGVVNHFAESRMVGVIQGWVPNDDVSKLEEALAERFPGKVMVSVLPVNETEVHHVPTLLKNHPILKPFEVLLSILRPPTYGTFDPTGLVAVSFILFYGFILGDVVYGFAVLLFAIWLNKKWGYNPIVRSASTVGKYMAASSMVFGVLFGEYCGDIAMRIFGVENVPHILHRSHDLIPLLIAAIVVGVVHIPLALVLGVREAWHHGHKAHAYERLGMLLGLTGIGLLAAHLAGVGFLAAGAFLYVAIATWAVGAGLIMMAMGLMGLVNVLEIFSLAGNVLSYARLMALGVASVIVADLANQLPGALGYVIGIPLALFVHLFNIGIGMFSPTLHSLRLNYVEFLPKFYSPEGKSYKPFKKEALW